MTRPKSRPPSTEPPAFGQVWRFRTALGDESLWMLVARGSLAWSVLYLGRNWVARLSDSIKHGMPLLDTMYGPDNEYVAGNWERVE